MASLERTSLKILTKKMEMIAKVYFISKTTGSDCFLNDIKHDQSTNRGEEFISRVEETYILLGPLEQLIINNDFFYEDYPDWWVELFSKTTYLMLKRKALIHFLKIFYEE